MASGPSCYGTSVDPASCIAPVELLLAGEVEGATGGVREVAAPDPLTCHGISSCLVGGLVLTSPPRLLKHGAAPRGQCSPSRRSCRLRAAAHTWPSSPRPRRAGT